jgi:hypothetical protein
LHRRVWHKLQNHHLETLNFSPRPSTMRSITRSRCPCRGLPVGVRAREGPKPTSEFVLRVPNLDGDVKIIHGGLSWFGRKKALRPAGGSIVFSCT